MLTKLPFFFISLISIDFFLIDFNIFKSTVDIFHASTFLVPPLNFLEKGTLFKSTLYDYGFVANNIGLIFKFFTGYHSIGGIYFVKLLLVYACKFILIFISYKLVSYIILSDYLKKVLFIIFTFLVISLPDYYDFNSYFNIRHSLYLFFIFTLGTALCDENYLKLKFFLVGAFSMLSVIWWYDIGVYTNILITFTAIYLLTHKEIINFYFLFFGVLFSWILFFIILPAGEIKEFLTQVKHVYAAANQYILGIEYPKPFSANSTRWTKALIIIYLTALMLINLNFSKNYLVTYKAKMFIILVFLSGVLVFKSALMRSDSYHVKYSSGIYTLIFFFVILLFIFQKLEDSKVFKKLLINSSKSKLNLIICIFFTAFFLLNSHNIGLNYTSIKKINNFFKVKNEIISLVQAKDNLYLSQKQKSVLEYYKKISKIDNCTQIMSDDVSFTYFLKKPSCTQFFISSQIIVGYTENKFIEQLDKASPNIILYKSPKNILVDFSNMSNAIKYINQKYSFYSDYEGYIFYKINKSKDTRKN